MSDSIQTSSKAAVAVSLERGLLRNNLWLDLFFTACGRELFDGPKALLWLLGGADNFKRRISQGVSLNPATLPYDEAMLARIRTAKAEGHTVTLVSAADETLVRAVADHLGLFDGIAAAGSTPPQGGETPKPAPAGAPGLAAWLRLLRPHHWLKNLLVAIPLATAHQFTPGAILRTFLAWAAFSICASSVYVLNDLIDVEADRAHPLKKQRPFASGALSAAAGVPFAIVLLAASMTIAALMSWQMLAVLATYFVITVAYSLVLKRKMMIDVVTLSVLYAIRIIGGGVAISVPISEWLLAFSLFIFTSLALIKRHSELGLRIDAGLGDPTNRNYRLDDLPLIASLAAAAGYCAVIIFALYLSSDTVRSLYHRPQLLWLTCPLLVYWISRTLLLSHRRLMVDDPIVFAMKDKVSMAIGVLIVVIGFFAM